MSEPFLGELRIMSFNFPPKGWAFCNGQILAINQNQALFALLGTTYGGNGQSTFALPDLRGRVPIHMNSGFVLGQRAGEEAHTLIVNEMAAHTHLMQAAAVTAAVAIPSANDHLGQGKSSSSGNPAVNLYSTSVSPNTAFSGTAVTNTGGSQPHENRQPFLVLSVCIALQGIFPSQT